VKALIAANVGLLVISSRRVLRSAKLPSGGGHIERCAYDALDMFIEQNRDALQCNEIKMHKCSLQYATASRLSQLAPSATLFVWFYYDISLGRRSVEFSRC